MTARGSKSSQCVNCGGLVDNFAFTLPTIAGTVIFLIGVALWQRDAAHQGLQERFLALGTVFFASSFATFGVEHLVIARAISTIVPPWLPGRLFIAYFVGIALIAASLSFTFKQKVPLAAGLTALMFLLFVCLMHVPAAIHHGANRLPWLLTLRDSSFGIGAFALFVSTTESETVRTRRSGLLLFARIWITAVIMIFAIQQLLHPECSPGVPDGRVTPSWVPLPHFLGYAAGVLLLVCGLLMFTNRYARLGSMVVAMYMTFFTLFLYVPDTFMLSADRKLFGANYIFDTLLYAGAMLLVSRAMPEPQALAVAKEIHAPASATSNV